MNILMIAAENGAIPGGKVGGLADVIGEISPALAKAGHTVSIITPGYGVFVKPKRDTLLRSIEVEFCGKKESVAFYELNLSAKKTTAVADNSAATVTHFAIEHWLFSANGPGQIYSNDAYGPFATDAYKFSLFCAAVCELVKANVFGAVDVMHCHDWHTAPLLILRHFAIRFASLQKIPCVFSIHNLSYQGIRPIRGDDSSLEHWFPALKYALDLIKDPQHSGCINLMRAGINLADKVHTVSPTYAEEILRPSDPGHGFVGGEGLEADLNRVNQQSKLYGILNGCDYEHFTPEKIDLRKLWRLIDNHLNKWTQPPQHRKSKNNGTSKNLPGQHWRSHYFAVRRLQKISRQRKPVHPIFVSVGRLTEQKLKLLLAPHESHSALETLLEKLHPGVFIMLGSGDPFYEQFLTSVMARHENFLFLCGFSESLSKVLYQLGDLFVMPSSFEPCGISQLLALRSGMPCLVHEIGGLKDTIVARQTGFSFGGDSEPEQVSNLLSEVDAALDIFHKQPQSWQIMRDNARAQRFTWDSSARQYLEVLYGENSVSTKLKVVGK